MVNCGADCKCGGRCKGNALAALLNANPDQPPDKETDMSNPLAELLTSNAHFIKHPQHGRFMSPKGPVVGEHAAAGWDKAHAFEGKETPEEEALEAHEMRAADRVSAAAKNAATCKNQGKPAGMSALGIGTCGDRKPVVNEWSDAAREAAAAARGAGGGTMPAASQSAAAKSVIAGKIGSDTTHDAAAEAHAKARGWHVGQGNAGAAEAHDRAAKAHKLQAMVLTGNANPEGHNQYGGGAAGKSSVKAMAASKFTKSPAATAGDHAVAATAHRSAAEKQEKAGNAEQAKVHRAEFDFHQKMSQHLTGNRVTANPLQRLLNSGGDPVGGTLPPPTTAPPPPEAAISAPAMNGGFESDEQRNAFFGLLREGKGGPAGKAAGAKSDAAHAATDALSETAEKRSGIAKKVNKDRQAGEHAKAQAAHQEAAKAHWAAAKGTNDKTLKGQHELAAKHHFGMAKEHGMKTTTTNANPEGKNQYTGKGGTFHIKGDGKDDSPHRVVDGEGKTVGGDLSRTTAHYVAHQLANSPKEDHPRIKKGAGVENQRGTRMFNRDQVLDALTANCESAQDAAALNALPDSALQVIWNAKAPGSGADLTSGSDKPERVGAAPGKDRDESDEDWSDTTESAAGKKAPSQGVSTPAMNEDDEEDEMEEGEGMAMNKRGRRKLMSFDELLNNVDQETRESLLVGREAARNEKRGLVWQLIANVDDKETRQRLGTKLFKLPKAELEERLLLLPPTRNRREERPAPSYAGRGGAHVESFALNHGQADTDDVLPILTINDVPDPHRPKSQRQAATTA